jgi:endonuclease/exonuclease/phosphatase family metal-dependent hydrolase
MNSPSLRVATYNVHDCIGRDRRYDPQRIAAIVDALDADVVALQEVTLDHRGDLLATLQGETHMHMVDGTLLPRGIGRYGNLLLSRWPVTAQALIDLSRPGRESRGAIQAQVETPAGRCIVVATHLGLKSWERAWQMRRLADVCNKLTDPTVLMGDLNSWRHGALSPLLACGYSSRPVRSFPSRPWPLLALDRVLVKPPARLIACARSRLPLVDIASDHLPVVAEIAID